MDLTWALSQAALRVSARATVISRIGLGRITSELMHMALVRGLRRSSIRLTDVGFSTGLPYHLWPDSSRVRDPRECKGALMMEATPFL